MRRGPWSRAVLMVLALLFLVAPSISDPSEGDGPERLAPGRSLEWLLLIYMAADNTLGENGQWGNAAVMDIDEMEANFPSQGARVLVLADQKGDHNTALYDIGRYPDKGVGSPTIPLSNVNSSWSDEIRSSDWQVLRDFLIYGLGSSDAAHTMLVIWDHGSGWQAMNAAGSAPPGRSVAQDVTDGGIMDLRELRWALQAVDSMAGPLHLDIISFDACYMGTLEVFHQVSPWADICITSEDEQPFYGFNYSFVWRMGSQESYNPAQLSASIVADFAAEYSNGVDYPYSSMTAADLVVVRDDLESSFNNLSRELWGWMYEIQVRSQVRFYIMAHGAEQVGYSQTDVGDLLRILGSAVLPGNLSSLANITKADYDRMIIAEHHVAGGRNPYATGTTVYLPPDNLTYYDPIYDGSSGYLSLTGATFWDEMLREMCDPQERMRISVNVTALDPDQIADDLVLTVLDTTTEPFDPIEGARIEVPGLPALETTTAGTVMYKDLPPGRYTATASKDMLRARSEAKVLNIAPILRYTVDPENVQEGIPFTIDASSSYDPDGDEITFGWDMNVSDGMDYNDSSASLVELTFLSPRMVEIGLRVSDPLDSVFAQISVQVENSRPNAMLQVPSSVLEDQIFVADASGSTDTYPDNESLRYSFVLDGVTISSWSYSPYLEMSIGGIGDHEVKVMVMDDQNETAWAIEEVSVYGQPPTVWIEGPDSVLEDETFVLIAHGNDTISDISGLGFEWSVADTGEHLGNGREYASSMARSGTYNFSVTVRDEHGSTDKAFKEIDVLNAPPNPRFDLPETVLEDQEIVLDASSSFDTPHDMADLKYKWWIDREVRIDREVSGDVLYRSIVSNDSGIHLDGMLNRTSFSTPGVHRVALIVTDNDHVSLAIEKEIMVLNEAPHPSLLGPDSADEDQNITIRVNSGADTYSDALRLEYNWTVDGTGSSEKGPQINLSFTTKGTHTIEVRAIDDQGTVGEDTIDIVVRNVAPIARMVWRSSNLYAGDHLEVSAGTSSDTPSDNLTLKFVWSIDGIEVLVTKDRTAKFLVDDPGKHSIELKVVDDDGAESMAGPFEFKVTEKVDPMPFILVGAVAVLASAIVTAIVIARKVRRLPQAVEIEEAPSALPEQTGPTSEQMEDPQAIPIPEGLGPPVDPLLPDPPEIAPPLIGEAPISDPLPPEPVDPEIYD